MIHTALPPIHRIAFSFCTLFLFAAHVSAETPELEQWIHPFGIDVGKTKWSEVEGQFAKSQQAHFDASLFFNGLHLPMSEWQRHAIFDLEFAPANAPVTLVLTVDPDNIIQRMSFSGNDKALYTRGIDLISTHYSIDPDNSLFGHSYQASFLIKSAESGWLYPYSAELISASCQFQTGDNILYLHQSLLGELTERPHGIELSRYEDNYYTEQVPEPFSALPWAENSPIQFTSLTIVSPEYLRVFDENLRKKAEDPETDDNVRAMLLDALAKHPTQ